MSHAITGSLPWDLSGRTLSPEEYKSWCEERKRVRELEAEMHKESRKP